MHNDIIFNNYRSQDTKRMELDKSQKIGKCNIVYLLPGRQSALIPNAVISSVCAAGVAAKNLVPI